jgi:protein-disulfide isomerase
VLETEPEIVERYIRPGQVRLVYRHLQQLGETSELLSEASECAADQGRFWELRRAIYARQTEFYGAPAAALEAAAAEAGVSPEPLQACLDAATHEAAVRADYQAAIAEGVRTRPVFLIGERTVVGAQPFAAFAELLDQALGAQ